MSTHTQTTTFQWPSAARIARITAVRLALVEGFFGDALTALVALRDDPSSLIAAWEICEADAYVSTFALVATAIAGQECRACSDCDRPEWEDEGHSLGHGFVCEQCASDNYTTCEGCSELTYNDDVTFVNDDAYCDNRCLGRYCYWCEDCDEYDTESHDHDEDEDSCDCEAPVQRFHFPANGEGRVREDERLSVELPAGTIAAEGIRAITKLVVAALGGQIGWGQVRDTVESLDPVWQAKRGNFTRRLSTALHQQHSAKVPAETLSEIGNLARQHTSETAAWQVEFTRDLNLSRDEFYNDDSCWWTTHAISRCAFKAWGGIALRSFSAEYRHSCSGRAWIQPLDQDLKPTHDAFGAHAYVVYNGYGAMEGYTAARLVAHLTGRTYRKVRLGLDPQYVNSDAGYLVADEATCAATEGVSFYADAHDQLDQRSFQMEMA